MPIRTVGRYRLTKQLGMGMFSKVMLGIDDETHAQYAVKVMRMDSLEEMDMARYARREAAVLRKLSHPNIVAFVEAIQSDTKLFLIMELAPGSELLDIVAACPLNEPLAKVYMRQLVGAVAYLHSKGIVHRDLKPDNVLVDQQSQSLKIIDFGLTGLLRKNSVMRTSCGSSYYSAPEVTYGNGRGYDGTKADAWSLGILSYIFVTGAHPFVDADGDLMTATMRQGIVEYPEFLSRGAIHFISRLLAIDPRKRYSVAQVSLHPWLTGKPVPTGMPEGPRYHDRAKKPSVGMDGGRFSTSKRPGTFNGVNNHRSLFERSLSDRSPQSSSSSSWTVRRRSVVKNSSGSFLWFRRQRTPAPAGERERNSLDRTSVQRASLDRVAGQRERSSLDHMPTEAAAAAGASSGAAEVREKRGGGAEKGLWERDRGVAGLISRRGSLDRPRAARDGKITLHHIIGGRGAAASDGGETGPRVRRQLSLSSRTRALLMRGSQSVNSTGAVES